MKHKWQFSIGTLMVLTLLTAVSVRYWPDPETPEPEPSGVAMFKWFDDARGVIKQSYDGTWEKDWARPGSGCCIMVWQGSKYAYRKIQIQLPCDVKPGDSFDIRIVNSDRSETYTHEHRGSDTTYSKMADGEATVFCFYNPSMHDLTDATHNDLGTIAILDMTPTSVTISVDLIDDVTWRNYENGIPEQITLERQVPPNAE
jgi:hypothetical protein